MTNIEKALALINTFATGDTEKAASLLAEGYIQHNLAYGTGRDAFVGSVAWLASAPVNYPDLSWRFEVGACNCPVV